MLTLVRVATVTIWATISATQAFPRSIEPPPAGAARVVLTVATSTFFLGENVLVHYCLENTSAAPFQISFGGDSRGASRSLRFKMRVIDEHGSLVADPDPAGYHEGGIGGTPTIAPHDHWCQSLALMRYARIDEPGTYTIRVTHDLGWPNGAAPEGHTEVTLRLPSSGQAQDVVSTMLSLPTTDRMRYKEPLEPYQDFSTLRYLVYLAPLVRLVQSGHAEALAGVGSIPAPEATRALIDLVSHADPNVAQAAARTLAMRLPDPALDGALPGRGPFGNELQDPRRYLRDAGWRPEFAPDVRAAANRLLRSPDAKNVVQGAFMIEAVGDASNVASLSSALTAGLQRTLSLPFEEGTYPRPRGAMQELMRAADVIVARGYQPPARPEEPGDVVLWLVAFGRGARPDGWSDRLEAMLAHRIPYVRELALARLPADGPARLFDSVGAALASPDIDVQIAALDLVRRQKLTDHHDTVAALVRTAKPKDTFLLNFAGNALYGIGGRVEVLEIMASRLTEEDTRSEAWSWLSGVFESAGGGGSFTKPAELPAVSARWLKFLAAHRSEIEAGKRFSLEDPAVTPDLVPLGWTFSRAGKPAWPVRYRPTRPLSSAQATCPAGVGQPPQFLSDFAAFRTARVLIKRRASRSSSAECVNSTGRRWHRRTPSGSMIERLNETKVRGQRAEVRGEERAGARHPLLTFF